ncbi:MAG TPA: sigma-70 family RNA polymerase sigma factor [Gemmataceae bacterium]|jgi:RNA polymerase sigma factor (TIGR02999 family)|nr:sigma-70 family RNA polymerase sigma factor [Gemmataceae bacterium]
MSDVTRIFSAIEQGDPHAAEQLLPLVYEELRKLAAHKLAEERSGQTLQATALVHEAYLRLVMPTGDVPDGQPWDGCRHFFAAAAEAMRRILINRARDRGRLKRGGGWRRLRLEQIDISLAEPPAELLVLNGALEKLAVEDPDCAELVKLRFFAGLTLDKAARTLGVARRTADRHWAFARSWLRSHRFRGRLHSYGDGNDGTGRRSGERSRWSGGRRGRERQHRVRQHRQHGHVRQSSPGLDNQSSGWPGGTQPTSRPSSSTWSSASR